MFVPGTQASDFPSPRHELNSISNVRDSIIVNVSVNYPKEIVFGLLCGSFFARRYKEQQKKHNKIG